MADAKISALAAKTTPASADLLVLVDVTDTSMAPSGTNKQATVAQLAAAVSTALGLGNAATHAATDFAPAAVLESMVTGLVADLAAKAPLASPALAGTPTAPTAAVGTNTTQVATTAFVLANGGGGGGSTSFPLLAPAGSASAPSYSFSTATDAGMFLIGGQLTLQPGSAGTPIVLVAPATGNTIQFHVIPQVAGGDGVIKVGTLVGATPYQYRIAAKNGTTNLVIESNDQVPRITVTPTGGPIFENTSSTAPVVFRQSGGVAGTNEAQVYHTPTDLVLAPKNAGGSVAVVSAYSTGLGLQGWTSDGTGGGGGTSTGAYTLNPGDDNGTASLLTYNDNGTRLVFRNRAGTVTYGSIIATSTGMALANFHPGTLAGGGSVGSTLTLVGSDNASPVNAHVKLNPAGHGQVGVGTGSNAINRRLEVRGTAYLDTGGVLLYTDDGTGWGSGTGSMILDPALSSGLASILTANAAGFRLQAYNAAGATLFGQVQVNSAGISLSNHPTGFFGATPAAKPTVTGSRGANAALASLLAALAALGLITDSSS